MSIASVIPDTFFEIRFKEQVIKFLLKTIPNSTIRTIIFVEWAKEVQYKVTDDDFRRIK